MSRIRAESPKRSFKAFFSTFFNAISKLETSLSPSLTISRLITHSFTLSDGVYVLHILQAIFWLVIMQRPAFPIKLLIPILYSVALLIPLTSQFFLPATPVFAWLLTFYTSRFIPSVYRPAISVFLLPTLEAVLYGANISDILTRFTHPILDIIAWFPYGVIHYIAPFVVAAALWLYAPKPALKYWANVFGYMNLAGVWCQILFPCSPPWYELIYGLTPADYSMPGSPGGLARIDSLFHSKGYTTAFSNAPVVFGAFPSLHSGHATLEALVVSHFFPSWTPYVWAYAGTLYWATMYLTHHYLIDVVGGACFATAFFYLLLPIELDVRSSLIVRNKHELYHLETPIAYGRVSASPSYEQNGDEPGTTYCSPTSPNSAAPFFPPLESLQRSHTSTASLIRTDERVRDGQNPTGQGRVVLQTSAGLTPADSDEDSQSVPRHPKVSAN